MSRNKTECCVLRLGGITINNSVYTTQSQHTAFSFVEWIVDYYLEVLLLLFLASSGKSFHIN